MLFPISDDDRELRGIAPVTIGLILANLAVFFLLQRAGSNEPFIYGWSVIPAEIWNGIDLVLPETVNVGGKQIVIPQAPGPSPIYLTIFSAMFMHGGLFHLFGNMLYLWIFGDNVEQRFGSIPFMAFYLLSGVVATLTQVFIDPVGVAPNLGASGAISGVMGAYLVLFPRNRVHAILFWFVVSVPAVFAIGMWIILQLLSGLGSLAVPQATAGGVAYGAHIGGFAAGVVMALVLRVLIREEPRYPYEHLSGYERPRKFR